VSPGTAVISILLVDDHPVVRNGVRGMLDAEEDLTVVGEAGSGIEAVAMARELRPDVILMDLRMPGLDGVGATTRILAESRSTKVLVLTTYETDADILHAVEAGASGYLLKDATRADLTSAIRAAKRGETVLARSGSRPSPASRPGSWKCSGWSPRAGPTPTSGGRCTFPRRR
jgi:DNA-binding NarL/FixJ family response regulator